MLSGQDSRNCFETQDKKERAATGSTSRPANKGTSADDGKIRDHVFTHNFVGGNSYIPGKFGSESKSKMAEERLKNAATLSIDTGKIREGELSITITNSGAGHDLPTGLTDVRQMWLEITVLDEKGVHLYSSGKLDKNGHVPENAIMFNTVYGDGNGKPVLNIAKAREILKDKRIPPLQSANEKITFTKKSVKKIDIHVKLLYRSAPKKVLDHVLGKDKLVLPVITMAEIDKKIIM